jgi:hypothetical protein
MKAIFVITTSTGIWEIEYPLAAARRTAAQLMGVKVKATVVK